MPPPDPAITPQRAAQELLRRRGVLQPEDLSVLARAIADFSAGRLYPDELIARCEETLGLRFPLHGVCPNHTAPGAYLLDALSNPGLNAIVWAGRGCSKTLTGGLLSVIESERFKGCETLILGGSERQSEQMYEHVKKTIDEGALEAFIDGVPTATRARFKNGSKVRMLTASHLSVRGPHPPRLRLDEVAEFDPGIYDAAVKMLQSRPNIPAALHIYSTMNHAGDLMSKIVDEAPDSGRRLYTWCILDVAERCEGRDCEKCVLFDDCKGLCKNSNGYFKIDDIIMLKTTPGMSTDSWESEMRCLRPGARGLVWSGFDEQIHLWEPAESETWVDIRSRLKRVVAGVDWGYVNPTAIIVLGEDTEGIIWVVDEKYQTGMLPEESAAVARELHKKWGIQYFFADPADQAAIEKWRRMGLKVAKANNDVERGVDLVGSKFLLLPPHRRPRMRIAKNCINLRREIRGYRRRGEQGSSRGSQGDQGKETIVKKDDHGSDALRYGLLGLQMMGNVGGY